MRNFKFYTFVKDNFSTLKSFTFGMVVLLNITVILSVEQNAQTMLDIESDAKEEWGTLKPFSSTGGYVFVAGGGVMSSNLWENPSSSKLIVLILGLVCAVLFGLRLAFLFTKYMPLVVQGWKRDTEQQIADHQERRREQKQRQGAQSKNNYNGDTDKVTDEIKSTKANGKDKDKDKKKAKAKQKKEEAAALKARSTTTGAVVGEDADLVHEFSFIFSGLFFVAIFGIVVVRMGNVSWGWVQVYILISVVLGSLGAVRNLRQYYRKTIPATASTGSLRFLFTVGYDTLTKADLVVHFLLFLFVIVGLFDFRTLPIVLLDLMNTSPRLMNVLRAFTDPYMDLILTFMLFLVMLYIFSSFAFTLFAKDMLGDGDSHEYVVDGNTIADQVI